MAGYIRWILAVLAVIVLTASETQSVCTTTGATSESVDAVQPRMRRLLSDIPSDITALRAILDNELNTTPRYKTAWNEAKIIFQQRRSNLVNPGFEWIPEEYHIALIAYTLSQTPAWPDTAFYSDFNKQTRELCLTKLNCAQQMADYPFKSAFKLISLAIDALSFDPKFQVVKPQYFRGASFPFALCEGQEIEFQSFTSTSINKLKAEEYSKNVTFFEFHGPPMPKSIYLKYHSGFPEEEEVLVSPLTTFVVDKIDFSNAYVKYVLHPVHALKF